MNNERRLPVPLVFSGIAGFSLLEISLVLLLMGLLLSLGTACWGTLVTSRRIAQTRSDLLLIKQCLVRHAAGSGRFPTYLSSTDCAQDQETDLGVCLCRTRERDVWGNAVLFLEGRDSSGSSLAGKNIVDNAYQGDAAASVSSDFDVTDHAGNRHTHVAFVLVSLGPNGSGDGVYDAFSAGVTARTMTKTADFSSGGGGGDDIYLIVTARELRACLRE